MTKVGDMNIFDPELEYPNCDVYPKEGSLVNNQFEREEDLAEFIINNIKEFTQDILEDELIEFHKNKPIKKLGRLHSFAKRIDLLLECKNRNYIIELKNPKFPSENRHGIGQLLNYGREYAQNNKKATLVLITTLHDMDTALTIREYKLPIRYFFIEKMRVLEFKTNLTKLDNESN